MSQPIVRVCLLLVAVIAAATRASAQDDPKFALITSVPAANAGFQWEVTRRFAIRIDGTYSSSHEEEDYVQPPQLGLGGRPVSSEERTHIESSTQTTTFNVSGIMTIRSTDRVRLYVAPRVLFGFSNYHLLEETGATAQTTTNLGNSTLFFNGSPARSNENDQSSTSVGGGASFGAEGRINDALSLFTEFGLTYSRSDAPARSLIGLPTSSIALDSSRTSVNTRAVAGVMFRF